MGSSEFNQSLYKNTTADKPPGGSPARQYNNNGPYSSPPQPPRKRFNPWKISMLVALLVVIVAGSVIGYQVLTTSPTQSIPGKSTTVVSPTEQSTTTITAEQGAALHYLLDHLKYSHLASLYVKHMSLDDELAQLMMVLYEEVPAYTDSLNTMIQQQHVGGVILYAGNISTAPQTKQLTSSIQQNASIPVLISIDQEGWNVNRLSSIYGRDSLSAENIHDTGDPNKASAEGQRIGQRMLDLGINVNFAPDIDVGVTDGYIDWDRRSFGTTADEVIKYAGPYMKAQQQVGVIDGVKHFVGMGRIASHGTQFDPHSVLPTIDTTKEQLYNTDLMPFKHFIQSMDPNERPGMVMPSDLMVPSIDPTYPTEFSHAFITDILRHELGYDGVVVTDSLQMGGVEVNGQHLTVPDAALLALQAGDDMLLDIKGPAEVTATITKLKDAIQSGTLTKARVDEAATHILTLKMERHLMPAVPPQ